MLPDPARAVVAAPLHLHHMRHRMDRPQIARIGFERRAALPLGQRVVAVFLAAESVHAEHIAVSGNRRAPCGQHPFNRGAHGPRIALCPEVREMRQPQRDQILRPLGEDRLPGRDCIGVARHPPRGQGAQMQLLALVALRRGAHGIQAIVNHAERVGVRQQHPEVALHDVRQRRSRIGLRRNVDLRSHVGAEPEVGLRGAIERGDARGRVAGDREAARVVHFSFE